MPLLDPVSAPKSEAPKVSPVGEGKDPYWRRVSERKRAEQSVVIAFLKTKGPLPPDVQAVVSQWENPVRQGSMNFGEPLFNKIFGAAPKVGDAITLQEVFNKTFKGVDKMNFMIRKWADKKIAVVEYVLNQAEPIKSQYVIKSLGA